MKVFLISDNDDTMVGMRLAGVEGVIAHDAYKFKLELGRAAADKDIAVVIITEKLSRGFPETVRAAKLDKNLPLIVEIPDRHGTERKPDFLTHYVREAVGIKI
ncbi:MAG: V-type ATP synthase subunit F [Clostridiales bacterium]|nr:V-type ATP synthase subunit F [Clostridiales bacterium]